MRFYDQMMQNVKQENLSCRSFWLYIANCHTFHITNVGDGWDEKVSQQLWTSAAMYITKFKLVENEACNCSIREMGFQAM